MSSSDPVDVFEAERQAHQVALLAGEARRQEIADVKWLMGCKQGRRMMWRLLAEAGLYRTSFSTNGSTVMFNEGKRHIGLVLIGEINEHCQDQFVLMLRENQK